jgi:hypothetical protein
MIIRELKEKLIKLEVDGFGEWEIELLVEGFSTTYIDKAEIIDDHFVLQADCELFIKD